MRNALFATSAVLLAIAPAATAQTTVEGRVDRLEKEMRAVQRKVFPGGQPLEAEISRPGNTLRCTARISSSSRSTRP
nr:hypothetical protein [Sphingobium sp.]